MACGFKSCRHIPISIKGKRAEKVHHFPYLGVTFDFLSTWSPCLLKRHLRFNQSAEALYSFAKTVGSKLILPILEMQKCKCLPVLMYGATEYYN